MFFFFSIYDIFVISFDKIDVDEKGSWLEICYGCFCLIFCFFLFIFVFGMVLLLWFIFYIFLINFNFFIIFIIMNKFGGDIGNIIVLFLLV